MGGRKKGPATSKRAAIGLREVLKQAEKNSISCVFFATDIEGAVRDKLGKLIRSIITTCASNNVLVVFSLTREQMSKALSKTGNISCVALLSSAVSTSPVVQGSLNVLSSIMSDAYSRFS